VTVEAVDSCWFLVTSILYLFAVTNHGLLGSLRDLPGAFHSLALPQHGGGGHADVISDLPVSELGPFVIHQQAANDRPGVSLIHLQATVLVGPEAVEDGFSYAALMALDLDLFDPRSTVGEVPMPAVGQDVLLTKNHDRGEGGALVKQLGILLNNVFIDLRPGLCAGVDSNED
jgi:hypothetical protein